METKTEVYENDLLNGANIMVLNILACNFRWKSFSTLNKTVDNTFFREISLNLLLCTAQIVKLTYMTNKLVFLGHPVHSNNT